MLCCAGLRRLFSVAVVLIAAGAAHADTLSGSFSGSFTSVTDPSGYLPAISVGSPFSVEYTVETDGVVGDVLPNFTQYRFFMAPASPGVISANVAGVLISAPLDVIGVGDDAFSGTLDYWGTGVRLSDPPLSVGSIYASLVFSDPTTTLLSSEALFGVNSLAGWTQAQMYLYRVEALGEEPVMQTLAVGTLEAVIPEPTTGLLLAAGLLALGCYSRQGRAAGR